MRLTSTSHSPARRLLVLLAGVAFGFSLPLLMAQTNATEKIIFLRLKWKDGAVTLLNASVTPGTLKNFPHPDAKERLHFAVENRLGEALWSGSVEDPAFHRHENAGLNKSDPVQSRIIPLAETEFMVRVPLKPEMHHVSFYRPERPPARAVPQSPAQPAASPRVPVGKIELSEADLSR